MISTNATGFTVVHDTTVQVPWQQVNQIIAFKLDLLTYDLICLAFQLDDERIIEVHEEMDGYDDLMQQVEAQFNLEAGWWSRAAFPAFETNMMTIWTRDANA